MSHGGHRAARSDDLRQVDRLHDLLQAFGPEAMHAAFTRAVAGGTIGVEYVEHFLGDAGAKPQMELPL